MELAIIDLIPAISSAFLAGPTWHRLGKPRRNSAVPYLHQPLSSNTHSGLSARLHGDFGNSAGDGVAGSAAIAFYLPGDAGPDNALSLIFAIMIGLPEASSQRVPFAAGPISPFVVLRCSACRRRHLRRCGDGAAALDLSAVVQDPGAVDLSHDPLGGLQTLLSAGLRAVAGVRHDDHALHACRHAGGAGGALHGNGARKGAGRLRVLIRHGLRNALLPVVTAVGVTAAHLIAGAVVVEQVLGLPGIGQLMLNAIYHRDYTQVQATVLVITTLVVLINIMIDLSYYLLDPRNSAAWLMRTDCDRRAGPIRCAAERAGDRRRIRFWCPAFPASPKSAAPDRRRGRAAVDRARAHCALADVARSPGDRRRIALAAVKSISAGHGSARTRRPDADPLRGAQLARRGLPERGVGVCIRHHASASLPDTPAGCWTPA